LLRFLSSSFSMGYAALVMVGHPNRKGGSYDHASDASRNSIDIPSEDWRSGRRRKQ
jgi:hypothetical protein